MKKIFLVFMILVPFLGYSQDTGDTKVESALKKFGIGADLFTDFWINPPAGIDVRGFNQGANIYGMYNHQFGESNMHFAFGIGTGFHNLYSNSVIPDIKADSIQFIVIPDTVGYKKSKVGLSYIDLPVELRFKTEKKFRLAVGFKLGYLIDVKTKFKGFDENGHLFITKSKQVSQIQKFRFGPTLRIGYDWFSVYTYFQVTDMFDKGNGPENVYPISLGITFLPF
jgi:hypothetical protein